MVYYCGRCLEFRGLHVEGDPPGQHNDWDPYAH